MSIRILKVWTDNANITFEYEASEGYPETAIFSRNFLAGSSLKEQVEAAARQLKSDLDRVKGDQEEADRLRDIAQAAVNATEAVIVEGSATAGTTTDAEVK